MKTNHENHHPSLARRGALQLRSSGRPEAAALQSRLRQWTVLCLLSSALCLLSLTGCVTIYEDGKKLVSVNAASARNLTFSKTAGDVNFTVEELTGPITAAGRAARLQRQ